MRVSKRRYHNEILGYALAARMVTHEARTDTIRRWSGVSEDRIRLLYRANGPERGERPAVRHRGPAPRQSAFFLRTAQIRSHAGALAGMCSLLGIIPAQPLANARRELPGLHRGELLCCAYEMFRSLVGASEITLEYSVLLVVAIAQGTQLRLGNCLHCGAAIVFDPSEPGWRACRHCRNEVQLLSEHASAAATSVDAISYGTQQSLF